MNVEVMIVVLVAQAMGCYSVPPKPVIPANTLAEKKLEIADEYCRNLQVHENERSFLRATQVISLGALGIGAIAGVAGAAAFFDESNEADPSSSSLENRGAFALVGAVTAAIASGVYAYSSKEIAAKKAASNEMGKTRALARDASEAVEQVRAGMKTSIDATVTMADPETINVPDKVMSSCYEIALADEDREQSSVNDLIKELTQKIRQLREEKLKQQMRMELNSQ